jgi:hypothetical protein
MVSGKKHGKGIYIYLNGNKYEGEWAFDKKNGHGAYYYVSINESYKG